MCLICGTPSADHSSQIPRRNFLGLLGASLAAAALAPVLRAAPSGPPPKPQNVLTPDAALDRLKAGNARFVEDVMKRADFASERRELAHGQNPFAGILSCSDSRVGPEFVFDTTLGDIISVRVAGNFVEPDGLASLEYATGVLGTPLLVVLGHDSCGALHAAVDVVEEKKELPGHLPELVSHLTPAVKAAEGQPGDLLANAIKVNVTQNVEKLKTASPVISKLIADGKVRVVGGIYHLESGAVDFFV